jgi:Flp pilus assembly pilin Flp
MSKLINFDIWDAVANWPNKRGQTMTEYALILATVAVAAVVTYIALGTKIKSVITG